MKKIVFLGKWQFFSKTTEITELIPLKKMDKRGIFWFKPMNF